MKKVFFSTFLPVLILSAGLLTVGNLNAQSAKKQALAEEKREADALAYSFVNCHFKLLQYQSKQDKSNNKILAKELNNVARLRSNLSLSIWRKYRNNENDDKQFSKELLNAEKRLSVCLKYQNILKALDEKQKSKTGKSE